MIDNFRWLVEGRVAGSGVPRATEDIEWLKLQGVDTIVSFSKISPKLINKVQSLGMRHFEIPIEDYGTPERGILLFADEVLTCMGRTGTMFALYLVNNGLEWQKAVERGGGLETGSQRLCVQIYQEHKLAEANLH